MNQPQRNRAASFAAARSRQTAAARTASATGSASGHRQRQPQPNPTSQSGQPTLRIVPLGGLGEVGKNLNILEYGNDAIVLDAGFKLGVDLPGINYAIPQLDYLKKIKHKVKAYVFTHGHLDHVGAMPYTLPIVNAPCYGSQLTLGMLERIVADRDVNLKLDKRVINPDSHERVVIGPFTVELVRVTHSIPDACAAVIDTPAGRVIHTGDFRIDPSPLDGKKVDTQRLEELGREGVTLLMSDSTGCEKPGHTETEQHIQPTLEKLITEAPGRAIISSVSTNINRLQMIINSAVRSGRKVAIDGRSMLANIELAVKLGFAKIPSGTVVAMRDAGKIADRKLAVVSTGHQGELNSVLHRMASGEHKHIKLKASDTVILSASTIPGNEKAVVEVVDGIMREGVRVYQHVTRDIDGIGPLHVSGHASRDELVEMIKLTRPKFFMPIHGEYHHQVRHAQLAHANGIAKDNVNVCDNGDLLEMTRQSFKKTGTVPGGAVLIDQTGAVVPDVVVKDRLLMSEDGIVVVMLTLDGRSRELVSSPDIITRGFIYMRENEELLDNLRRQLRNFTARRARKVELDRFKAELRDDINQFLYKRTERSPIIIPVVNVVKGGAQSSRSKSQPGPKRQPKPRPSQPQSR